MSQAQDCAEYMRVSEIHGITVRLLKNLGSGQAEGGFDWSTLDSMSSATDPKDKGAAR
jgi:hypothetical protein